MTAARGGSLISEKTQLELWLRVAKTAARNAFCELTLTFAARVERRRDSFGLSRQDPGLERVLVEAMAWLKRAQDRSTTRDGGVARHYSLLTGWSPSYPETTGYIVPTMLAWADVHHDEDARYRARRMLDWIVSIQLPCGAFQGGIIGAPPVPVGFNTGQILLGLSAGARAFGDRYREAMIRAADWLVAIQNSDGAWRRYLSPFASKGEKTYETHTAWGLFEAARVAENLHWANAALRNVDWAITLQRSNGWLDQCCLSDYSAPLTHTLGYALRGLFEAWRFAGSLHYLDACRRLATGLVTALAPDGFLPGRLHSDWTPAVSWACLTGTAQVACCFFLLYTATGEEPYLEAGRRATSYLRRTIAVAGTDGRRGGVKGSFPVHGGYATWEYLNWASKFVVDALMLEQFIGVSA